MAIDLWRMVAEDLGIAYSLGISLEEVADADAAITALRLGEVDAISGEAAELRFHWAGYNARRLRHIPNAGWLRGYSCRPSSAVAN